MWAYLLAFAAALAVGIGVTALLARPPRRELAEVSVYLAASGAVTFALGWGFVHLVARSGRLSLRAQFALAVGVAAVIAVANVLVTAVAMFISTGHDLPLLVGLLIFAVALTVAFGLAVSSRAVGRLGRIGAGIEALAAGDYDHRVPDEGRDEIAEIAGRVNVLAERLLVAEAQQAAAERERRELTIAISHDLRTPLASVRAMVEALEDGVVAGEDARRYYASIAGEIDRTGAMLDDLFELSRLEAGGAALGSEEVELAGLAAGAVEAFRARAAAAGVSLSLAEGAATATVRGDSARIQRALANLLVNAIEHTPAGGSVSVAVTREPHGVALSVADTGAGIPPAGLDRVWERFFRGDRARARGEDASKAGLGLAIVKAIVEAHGGAATVASEPGCGAVFTLTFPRSS